MAAAFACLKEFNERFDDDSFAEFRRREEAVVEDIMSVVSILLYYLTFCGETKLTRTYNLTLFQPEYLEAVAKIADKFTNR